MRTVATTRWNAKASSPLRCVWPTPAGICLKRTRLNAAQALALIGRLYEVERAAHDLDAQARLALRRSRSKPVAQELHEWLKEKRQLLAKSDVTAKAIDYSLCNWSALTRYLADGNVPIDNNAAENSIRPLAVGRKNWLLWDHRRPVSAQPRYSV